MNESDENLSQISLVEKNGRVLFYNLSIKGFATLNRVIFRSSSNIELHYNGRQQIRIPDVC